MEALPDLSWWSTERPANLGGVALSEAMPGQSTQQATRRILESSGTLIETDHFVYASGDQGAGGVARRVVVCGE